MTGLYIVNPVEKQNKVLPLNSIYFEEKHISMDFFFLNMKHLKIIFPVKFKREQWNCSGLSQQAAKHHEAIHSLPVSGMGRELEKM